jgi:hypothetical protein
MAMLVQFRLLLSRGITGEALMYHVTPAKLATWSSVPAMTTETVGVVDTVAPLQSHSYTTWHTYTAG